MPSVLVLTALVILQFCEVRGHGRLIEPAARNAMWRFKYKNPRNYNDMGLNCGGFTVCINFTTQVPFTGKNVMRKVGIGEDIPSLCADSRIVQERYMS